MRVAIAAVCFGVLLLSPVAASAETHNRDTRPFFAEPPHPSSRPNVLFWYDNVEEGESFWTHGDATATAVPHFHVDTYYADPEGAYSYWCGTVDPGYAGGDGYGNAWDQRLVLPPIDLNLTPVERMSWGAIKAGFGDGKLPDVSGTRSAAPVLTFRYRCDSEQGYDFTYVQAKSGADWISLNDGYTGASGGWQESEAFDLSAFGDLVELRFRFLSDGAWSDEDGLYDSDGGAFHVDDIRVFDSVSGEEYFSDDCEDAVGLCRAAVPPPGGDFWHIIDRSCPALSDPHSWWCGDDADTSLVPPGLNNWLRTPLVDLSLAVTCTVHFAIHFAVPKIDHDYVEFLGTCNGEDYYSFGTWWGDFGTCNGWGDTALNVGFDIGQSGSHPYAAGGFEFVFHTDDNGCGPGAAGDAGVMIDDIWFEGWPYMAAARAGEHSLRPAPPRS
jgi:hypothetical protein